MEEIVEDHKNELSAEELKQLQEQQQKVIVEEMSSGELGSSLTCKICPK